MSTVSDKIAQQIQQFPEDISFGYKELTIARKETVSAAKALERLQKKGLIRKLSKGIFYKPKMTLFGEKKPDEQQVLKPYLYQNGKRTAYITGVCLYNQLGLTTQVPAIIKIASRDRRIFISTGALKATPIKSYVDVTEDNYQMLGFLDAMKDLKHIPDIDINNALSLFKNRISQLTEPQRQEMIQFGLAYPPRVRALLGAILDSLGKTNNLEQLRLSVNPLTDFVLGISIDTLPEAANWNIR